MNDDFKMNQREDEVQIEAGTQATENVVVHLMVTIVLEAQDIDLILDLVPVKCTYSLGTL